MDAQGEIDVSRLSDRDKQELQQFIVNETQKSKIQQCMSSTPYCNPHIQELSSSSARGSSRASPILSIPHIPCSLLNSISSAARHWNS